MTMRTDALCLRSALPDAPLLPELRSQEQHVSRCRFAFSFSFGNHSLSPPTPLPECLMNFERSWLFPSIHPVSGASALCPLPEREGGAAHVGQPGGGTSLCLL